MSDRYKVLPSDVDILRKLAHRFREACESDENQEVRRLWYAHDLCRGERPLLLTELDGGLELIIPDLQLQCQEPWARHQEFHFREKLAHVEIIGDDTPLEPYAPLSWAISKSNYGIDTHETMPDTDGTRGALHIDAVITDLKSQFHLLRPRTFSVNREATLELKAILETAYDGILPVRLSRNPWWTQGLTQVAISLIGLENLMLYMYDQPEELHGLMAFLRDDAFRLLDWMEREGLLVLNNLDDYCGSGSRGYTRALPSSEYRAGQPVRTQDLWALLESQETVGVGPEMYAEFIFPYEDSLARRFGRVYYGCCEPLHTRWDVVKKMANLKRVSISPWCDEKYMAQQLGGHYVYSRKPKPTLVSTEQFDEGLVRQDLRTTMEITREHGCSVEIIMKDVHTLSGHPDRLTRWVQIAREETAGVYGE